MPKKKRLAGRTTKVHLQAVPKTEKRGAKKMARERLAGLGQFLQGQAELTIENSHVSESSVVIANLLSNPGPVVVQYYTLLPGYGFKVHLSAPVTADTPFNYVILLGELF